MVHVAVIGAYGSAGSAVASRLATEPDVDLTLIDNGDPGGGLCILRGCMPSKEVLSAGAHRYQARADHRLSGAPSVDLESVYETKEAHIQEFAAHRRESIHELANQENVEFLHTTARFVGERTIAVGDRTITPDYVVIATGSTVNIPDLPGIRDVEYHTSDDVLSMTSFPDSGIVMGFGYTGLELTPYLSEVAGMDLTVIEHDKRPLPDADPEYGDRIISLYESEFDIDILTRTDERALESTADGGVRLHTDRDDDAATIEADTLFLFTGRRPNLDVLNLEQTALSPEPGWVADTMQARDDDRFFVVGDANNKELVLHVAKEQAAVAAENILNTHHGEPLEPYDHLLHRVIFTGLGVYPYTHIGHSATSAQAADGEYIAVTREARDDGIFRTKDVPEGMATLVVDATDGTVVGYQGLHNQADVMAKTMQVIIELGLDVRELPDRAYHPTTPEILDGLFRQASDALTQDG